MSIRGALLIVCALAGVASAETPQQQADKLFAEGRDLLMVKKDAKAACEKFEAAIQLDATATGTMLNLGLCYETLGKYAKSISWFRKAQTAAAEAQPRLGEYEEAAKTHTQAIASKVPSLKLEPSIPEAEIRIDGQRIAPTEYGKAEVDPGPHEIVGSAPGKKKVVQKVDLKEGENQTIVLTFNEAAVPVYLDRGKGRRKGAIILGVAGLGAMAFSGIFSAVEKSAWNDETSPTEQDKIKSRVRYLGTGAFIVGAGALIAGGILYFTAPGKEQISDGTAFAPTFSQDGAGFAVSGSF